MAFVIFDPTTFDKSFIYGMGFNIKLDNGQIVSEAILKAGWWQGKLTWLDVIYEGKIQEYNLAYSLVEKIPAELKKLCEIGIKTYNLPSN